MADTIKLGPFTGINNRLKRHALYDPVGKTYALLAASNVDVDTTGRLSRRSGFTADTALTSGDSLWSDGTNLYYRDNGNLYRDRILLEAVSGRCSYTAFPGGGVIYTDGTSLRFISAAGAATRLSPAKPTSPSLSATTGSLQPAKYVVAITGVSADGVEGPACAYQALELTAEGGISLALPALPSGAAEFNVYVTGPNGEAPALHGSTSGASYTVTTYASYMTLKTGGMVEMPAGDIVRIYNGRLLVADGNVLYISEAYDFGVYDPSLGYILFPADISIVIPMQNGVYVVADKTYWILGADVRQSEFTEVLPYGAIAHSDALGDTNETAYWVSVKGVIVGDQTGQVRNIQEQDLALNDSSASGAILVLSGEDRLIAATNG